ncbi:MAG: hypothetical protein KGI51_16145, partial [Rhodospirillales bacterium]|nr:hypothetical protein [Rhodospirillales bacterium]
MRFSLLAGTSVAALLGLTPLAGAAPVFSSATPGTTGFTIQTTGLYDILVEGAQGGNAAGPGGLGAKVEGELTLTAGEALTIVVGGAGGIAPTEGTGAGGGGGSFILGPGATALAIAGGGGGAGSVFGGTVTVTGGAGQAGKAGQIGGGGTGTSPGAGGTGGAGGGGGVYAAGG